MIRDAKIGRSRPVLGIKQGWNGSPVGRRGAQMRAPTNQGNQKLGKKDVRASRIDWLSDRAI